MGVVRSTPRDDDSRSRWDGGDDEDDSSANGGNHADKNDTKNIHPRFDGDQRTGRGERHRTDDLQHQHDSF